MLPLCARAVLRLPGRLPHDKGGWEDNARVDDAISIVAPFKLGRDQRASSSGNLCEGLWDAGERRCEVGGKVVVVDDHAQRFRHCKAVAGKCGRERGDEGVQ